MGRKRNTPPLLVGLKLVQPLWKLVWGFLRTLGMTFLEDPAIPLLAYTQRIPWHAIRTYCICSIMSIAALFIIARSWKEPRCPLVEEWIQKMWYIYTREYYSAIKNNEFMKFLGKWLELENIILCEVTQSPKSTYGISGYTE